MPETITTPPLCATCGSIKRLMYHGGSKCLRCSSEKAKATREANAKQPKAPVPRLVLPAAAQMLTFPWPSVVCDAVRVGIASASAQKRGLFYVVALRTDQIATFVPCRERPLPIGGPESILLVAKLSASKWQLRPPKHPASLASHAPATPH